MIKSRLVSFFRIFLFPILSRIGCVRTMFVVLVLLVILFSTSFSLLFYVLFFVEPHQ